MVENRRVAEITSRQTEAGDRPGGDPVLVRGLGVDIRDRPIVYTYVYFVRPVMIEVKIRKVGNSAVVTLSAEMLALLDAKEGDTLYAVRTDDGGLKLLTENPQLQAELQAAEIVMDENRDLLQALA
jgi:putative addiction module antidote